MREYYILSLKWTRSGEEIVTWWGPNNSGYVSALEQAGRYTEDDIKAMPSYYDNREATVALPCELVDQHAIRVVHSDSLHRLVSDALGVNAFIYAPWEHTLDENGKPYECGECETRPTHKGPSKLVIRGPVK